MTAAESTDVLVVDDDPEARESIVESLTLIGYDCAVAANGAEALAYLKRRPTNLVLLDLMMPVMDGWEFRFRQQVDPALAEIPVVLLSAAPGLEGQASAMAPSGYLPKPVDLLKLQELVSRYCDY